MYLDYNFYESKYDGKISHEDFIGLELKAAAVINYYTSHRIKEVDDNIKFCMCELIDNIKEDEEKEIASESVGSYSVSYVNKGNTSNTKNQKSIIAKWLPSNLIYRGV